MDEEQTLPVVDNGEQPREDDKERESDELSEKDQEEADQETTGRKMPIKASSTRKKAAKPPPQKRNAKTSDEGSENVAVAKKSGTKKTGMSTAITNTPVYKKATRSMSRKK